MTIHHCRECMGRCELIDAAYQRGLDDATSARRERAAAFKEAIQIAKEEAYERRLAYTVYERLVEATANENPKAANK